MILRNGKIINKETKPYIIAELNTSHKGIMENAIQMIDAARNCGCDAVKFQSWSSDSLYCKQYYDSNPISKRMIDKFSMKPDKIIELSQYCKETGIDFSSTPYSKEEVDVLVDNCDVPFVKVASMDINNLPFLEYIARKGVPIVISTGMATIEEIDEAVNIIELNGGKNLCILHCVSQYPVDAKDVNLNNVVMLRERYPQHEIGYSDHTIGCEVACAAVALGANIIEKHFTLDNKKIGWDNQMATEPDEMKRLVDSCNTVYICQGSFDRCVSQDELLQRKKMRRGIVSTKDLKTGKIIEVGDIAFKRPAEGLTLDRYRDIIGKAILRDIPKDYMIKEEDIDW